MTYKIVECVVPCKITYIVEDGEDNIRAAKEMLPSCVELEASHELLWDNGAEYIEKPLPENWENDYAIKRTIQLFEYGKNGLTDEPKKRKMTSQQAATELLETVEEL